jgi:molybdenum cofactor biosynthesis enzyme MoaA
VLERYLVHTVGAEPEEFEGHKYWNASVLRFDGQTLVISHRAILTLVTISGCNAACKFCSNEITFTSKGPYLRYDDRLQRVKDLALLAGVKKVAFTGGEPTVNPSKLLDLMSKVNPGFRKSRLHTNGFGLLHDVAHNGTTRPLIEAMIDAGLTGASVSVAHYDPETNRRVMRFKTAWRGLEEPQLREIASYRCDTFTPRLSCVLTEEGVWSLDEVLRYIEWGRELGFRRFIFRSPSGIPAEYSKLTEYTDYNASNHLAIDVLVDQLRDRPGWRETYSQHKSDSHVHVYEIDGEVKVDLDESAEEEDPDPKIRRLTVMPTGILYSSWIDPYSNIFPEDTERARADALRELPNLGSERVQLQSPLQLVASR